MEGKVNNLKEKYDEPVIEIIKFETEDVISTSSDIENMMDIIKE